MKKDYVILLISCLVIVGIIIFAPDTKEVVIWEELKMIFAFFYSFFLFVFGSFL